MTIHTSHPDIIKRLKRAEGHLKSIIVMLEEERGCLDIAQQLQAVESAVGNAKKALVHDPSIIVLNTRYARASKARAPLFVSSKPSPNTFEIHT